MLRDPADGDAALVHRGNVRRDRLVDGRLKAREELSLNRNLGDGAKPLRTRQRFVHGAEDQQSPKTRRPPLSRAERPSSRAPPTTPSTSSLAQPTRTPATSKPAEPCSLDLSPPDGRRWPHAVDEHREDEDEDNDGNGKETEEGRHDGHKPRARLRGRRPPPLRALARLWLHRFQRRLRTGTARHLRDADGSFVNVARADDRAAARASPVDAIDERIQRRDEDREHRRAGSSRLRSAAPKRGSTRGRAARRRYVSFMTKDALARLEALPDVLTLRELARVLRCSESTIKRRLRAGVFPIPTLRGVDKRMRFAKTAVVRYLDSNGRARTPRA